MGLAIASIGSVIKVLKALPNTLSEMSKRGVINTFSALPAFPAGIITLGDADPSNPTELLDRGGEVSAFLAEPFEVSEI